MYSGVVDGVYIRTCTILPMVAGCFVFAAGSWRERIAK